MQDLGKTKKELEKVLSEKESNLIRLYFDLYYRRNKLPEIEKEREKLNDKVVRLQAEVDVERAKPRKLRDKERLINLDTQLEPLKTELSRKEAELKNTETEVEKAEMYVKGNIELNEEIKKCIKNPKIIYEDDKR